MEQLSALVADTWRSALDRDWSAPAGTLEWSCTKTADHAVDTVFAPALFLASRRQDAYPSGYGVTTPGPEAEPALLIEALEVATRVLVGVVRTAPADVRAVIWRRPKIETRPPEDFVPRAGLELILHAHDVCLGLGVAYRPSEDLCERMRRHIAPWPFYGPNLTMRDDPWLDLLQASGRGESFSR
jgi:hypothetical protein